MPLAVSVGAVPPGHLMPLGQVTAALPPLVSRNMSIAVPVAGTFVRLIVVAPLIVAEKMYPVA